MARAPLKRTQRMLIIAQGQRSTIANSTRGRWYFGSAVKGQGLIFSGCYHLVMTNIAMENGPFIDGLPGFTS